MMNRRTFAQALAVSTGATLVGSTAADEPAATKQTAAQPEPSLPTPPIGAAAGVQPVCVADFRTIAQTKLPRPTFEFIETGSADQVTLRENTAAFQRLKLLPPVLSGVAATGASKIGIVIF